MASFVLTIVCPDRAGIVHAVSGMLVDNGGNILESQVLSRAVRWHAESRVLLNGHKTVVFR